MRKNLISFILALLTVFSFSSSSFAHSGRTDSNGGHWDRSTGTYHYHNGRSTDSSLKSNSKKEIITVKPSTSTSDSTPGLSKNSEFKKDEYFETMVDMYVEAFEEDNEERGTDYDIEVEYLEEGADIVIYCEGDEGIESITVHLNEYAQCTLFTVLYSDGTTQLIPD